MKRETISKTRTVSILQKGHKLCTRYLILSFSSNLQGRTRVQSSTEMWRSIIPGLSRAQDRGNKIRSQSNPRHATPVLRISNARRGFEGVLEHE